ncbi:glycosyltransferase [Anabaena sp. FACHB-709]|uniref:Glycosyltransferase n=2 Tax=Nostocaceae TaxID=1162 RepID=A0ABR7ZCE9_ANACY|nr:MULTISPECIES: glycosyltransferase [Nostocaceae]BAY67917.1 putative glycosyltransferase [Trichormus variabilis NIES-23]HBW29665.1 glycosyltransferase family 1 protein [Nostoc sp. UBA8866]MBD2169993.1 glycosyltransferase [Anabaena cylindrica FACHB-318]MBD2261587.1 glycosyltransferase [Anabaena sp. FACHB-709]MBD2271171.1 glycosyltransferase [Nostoc sp. PCC 7120 = FACHB-418]
MNHPRLALVSNFRDEASPSMLVCGDRLYDHLSAEHPDLETTRIQPDYTYRLRQLPRLGKMGFARETDKMLNRFWDYPRHLKSQISQFDLFHICDQSYASLVNILPPERTGVFCHDLDVFRSILQPDKYPRSIRYNTIQRYALNGFCKAAVIFYTTQSVREEILHYQLISPDKLVQVPLGIAREFSPHESNANMAAIIQEKIGDRPFLLNISVNLQRKRLDVLLETYARLRHHHPDLLLVRVGAEWEPDMQARIDRLGIRDGIRLFPRLEQKDLAEFYRRAAVVLMTSEAEGFGMPLIEALACGSIIVVSDIPVLREVGGNAAVYCPVGKPDIWANTISDLLNYPEATPDLSIRFQQVKKYTWSAHAETIAQAYQERILSQSTSQQPLQVFAS